MCGIAGFWNVRADRYESAIFSMTNALYRRGPDDAGYWVDPSASIALGHRRLSILDLSEAGHQPMFSASRRYVIVYNGEVYNFEELRRRIEDETSETYPFRGGSDTEVILGAIELWGLERAVEEFVGMFAFALWDREERTLKLVRDRLGIKPVYYGWSGPAFIFGSELKALVAYPGFQAPINRDSLAHLLRYNAIPGAHTIYEGIEKLEPGCILTLRDPRTTEVEITRYWAAEEMARRGRACPFIGTERQAVDALEELLSKAVGMRMISDVPLGAFLSGGIDSSTVVALMQAHSSRPVRTFSIGFENGGYNEAEDAREVAFHLGCDHTELYVSAEDALAVIPNLPTLYDEPFADSSQIPTFLVSRLAREHVTVALSGDGGDELFGGYNRHLWGPRVWNALKYTPSVMRRILHRAATTVSPQSWDGLFERLGTVLPPGARLRVPGDKIHKLAGLLEAHDADALYELLTSHWRSPGDIVPGAVDLPRDFSREPDFKELAEKLMFRDLISYLPDDILTKVDRASMGVSLEARVPLLDHRVVEFAWKLPLEMKIKNGVGKFILRRLLYRYVPRHLVERPKMGFGIPIDSWLRGPLRPWAEEFLSEARLRDEGFFRPAPIRKMWAEHLSGARSWQHELWDVLMFQAWNDHRKTSRKRDIPRDLRVEFRPTA
ncbi:MAG: asparagine synthase (glutamine-hydrolyzing) [Bradymonadaceae bacterium]